MERLATLVPAGSLRQLQVGLNSEEITAYMQQQREGDWGARRTLYVRERIEDQIEWYGRKATQNNRYARLWFLAALATQIAAAGFACQLILRPESHWNLISFFTTVAASSVGWSQAKRHEELQTTYQLAVGELIEIKESQVATGGTEAEFVEAIVSGEGAISREHTVWQAKCGAAPKRRIRPTSI